MATRLRQLGRAALKYLVGISAVGLLTIAGYEGFSAAPYRDQAGVWTNGYGNTEQVGPSTPPVAEPVAREKLREHVSRAAPLIDKALTRPTTQGQADAYQSLAYNIGAAAFARSSVAHLHNAGRYREACDAILLYNKVRIRGVLTYSQGLANRRAAERNTCLKDLP